MPSILKAQSIQQMLVNVGVVVDPLMADGVYALLDLNQLKGELSDALRAYLAEDVGTYELEDADCDDFADSAATWIRREHRKTYDKPRTQGGNATAIAFAEFWYTRDDGNGHAINVFVSASEGVPKVYFYEPQLCQVVELSQREIASCEFVRF